MHSTYAIVLDEIAKRARLIVAWLSSNARNMNAIFRTNLGLYLFIISLTLRKLSRFRHKIPNRTPGKSINKSGSERTAEVGVFPLFYCRLECKTWQMFRIKWKRRKSLLWTFPQTTVYTSICVFLWLVTGVILFSCVSPLWGLYLFVLQLNYTNAAI